MIQEHLRSRDYDHGMKVICGGGHAMIKLGPATEKRAFRMLDALFKALSSRGHDVRLRPDTHYGPDCFVLEALIKREEPIEFWLVEHLDRSDRVLTEEEKRTKARYGLLLGRKYDYTPSGRLTLEMRTPWHAGLRCRWTEGKKLQLENVLGEVLVGLELAATAWQEYREQAERERELELENQRREERRRRSIAHRRALGEDLVKAAHSWQDAEVVSAFLAALDGRVPKVQRTSEFDAWFDWAKTFASGLDPLATPLRLARALDPPATDDDG
jgi:hypothetical protein